RQRAWVSGPAPSSPLLYAGIYPKGNMPAPSLRRPDGAGKTVIRPNRPPRTAKERWRPPAGSHLLLNSIRCDAGVLDDLRPQRDVRLDDVGELRPRRALRLATGDVELLAHVRRHQRGFQRLADALHNRLGRARRHHDAEPRRHLRLGIALLGKSRHVREIFRTAVTDRPDDPDGAGLHLPQRLVGR